MCARLQRNTPLPSAPRLHVLPNIPNAGSLQSFKPTLSGLRQTRQSSKLTIGHLLSQIRPVQTYLGFITLGLPQNSVQVR